jgi:hypothetical protein
MLVLEELDGPGLWRSWAQETLGAKDVAIDGRDFPSAHAAA